MRPTLLWMLAPLMLAATPLYGGQPQSRQTVEALSTRFLARSVKPKLELKGLTVHEGAPGGPEIKVKKLPRASVVALHTVLRLQLDDEDMQREWDLLVNGPEGITPVTLWFDADRVSIAEGAVYQSPPSQTREAFSAAWPQLTLVEVDAEWTPEVLGVVHVALDALPVADRELLDGLTLTRRRASAPDADLESVWKPPGELDRTRTSLRASRFMVGDDGARIELYDNGVRDRRASFVGPLDAPQPRLTAILVQQLALARLRASSDPAALIEAFEAARTRKDGHGPAFPDTGPIDAYIESYALWCLDRAALDRAMPGVGAWFDEGQPVE